MDHTNRLTDDQLAELARLADGTLRAEDRAGAEARVAASAELARVVERQRVALDALRAGDDVVAPARLRADVGRRSSGTPRKHRRIVLGGAVAIAAALAFAVLVVLPGSGSSAPTVAGVAAVAAQAPSEPAPAAEPGTPQLLHASVDDVPFPDYTAKFGYAPAGARSDDLSGRDATTVYYAAGDRTIAYTIVPGERLDPPPGASATTRGGVEYRSFRTAGRTVVTWERHGHTCVLSSTTAPAAELLKLADWRGKGAITV